MTGETITRARAAVARLREAEARATPGPWFGGTHSASAIDPGLWDGPALLPPGIVGASVPADLAAIVALRNAAPALLRLAEAVGRLIEARTHLNLYPGAVIDNEYAHDVLAAFADLAALAGDADAGEVGA